MQGFVFRGISGTYAMSAAAEDRDRGVNPAPDVTSDGVTAEFVSD